MAVNAASGTRSRGWRPSGTFRFECCGQANASRSGRLRRPSSSAGRCQSTAKNLSENLREPRRMVLGWNQGTRRRRVLTPSTTSHAESGPTSCVPTGWFGGAPSAAFSRIADRKVASSLFLASGPPSNQRGLGGFRTGSYRWGKFSGGSNLQLRGDHSRWRKHPRHRRNSWHTQTLSIRDTHSQPPKPSPSR